METLPKFAPFVETFADYEEDYREIFDSQEPHRYHFSHL